MALLIGFLKGWKEETIKKRMRKLGVKGVLRQNLGNLVCLSSPRRLGRKAKGFKGDGQLSRAPREIEAAPATEGRSRQQSMTYPEGGETPQLQGTVKQEKQSRSGGNRLLSSISFNSVNPGDSSDHIAVPCNGSCLSFSLLLLQITTNLVALFNVDLLSYRSGGQKSESR